MMVLDSAVGGLGAVGLLGHLPQAHEVRALFHPLQALKRCELSKSAQTFVADKVGALVALTLWSECRGGRHGT